MNDFSEKHCFTCEGGVKPMTPTEIAQHLKNLPLWTSDEALTLITRRFSFKDFYQTMTFVNAIAWIANRENHHPDLTLGYNYCVVNYSTHALGGLSENDFICAAKIDKLIE